MARRRKDEVWFGLVAQLMGLVMLFGLISPQVRRTISVTGFMAIAMVGLAMVILIGFSVYRFITRSQNIDRNVALEVNRGVSGLVDDRDSIRFDRVADVTNDRAEPQTTAALVGQLRSIDWFQFEKLVALVYRKLGYTVTRRGGANADGGIDLVIEKDGQRSAVQCKQWRTWNVGVKAVREFLGALTDAKIQKGVFITLCGYTSEAKQLAWKHGIEIVNEVGLATMLDATDARFDPETQAILRDTRKFCPKCESEMVLRKAMIGVRAGRQFWGCSTYPKCRYTMPTS